jgi:adenylate cyclase
MSLWERWIGASGSGVYVVDDFQHADMASLEVLEPLLTAAGRLPLLVILVLRPEQHTAAWVFHERLGERGFPGYIHIALRSLGEAEAGMLVDRLLSGMTPPDDFRETLIDRVGGNPLFAEEIVRSLIGRGMVVERQEGNQAALRFAPEVDLAEVTIPTTLRSLMQERMDRLSPDARRTLQIAAVIGRTFRHAEIDAVVEAPTGIDAQLMELQQALLIQRADQLQAREYSFNHALTWEAAYRIILFGGYRRSFRSGRRSGARSSLVSTRGLAGGGTVRPHRGAP